MTQNEFAIGGFTYPELTDLKTKVETRMEEMRATGVPALRERFAQEAAALGVTLDEIMASNKPKRGRPRRPRNEGEEVEAAV
jgi:hypothetical protein